MAGLPHRSHNEGVTSLVDPENWLYIAALTTVMLGGTTVIVTLTNRMTTAAIHGLRGELSGRIDALGGEVNGRIDALSGRIDGLQGEMNARFAAVDVRFSALEHRIDNLDRDVSALIKRALDS